VLQRVKWSRCCCFALVIFLCFGIIGKPAPPPTLDWPFIFLLSCCFRSSRVVTFVWLVTWLTPFLAAKSADADQRDSSTSSEPPNSRRSLVVSKSSQSTAATSLTPNPNNLTASSTGPISSSQQSLSAGPSTSGGFTSLFKQTKDNLSSIFDSVGLFASKIPVSVVFTKTLPRFLQIFGSASYTDQGVATLDSCDSSFEPAFIQRSGNSSNSRFTQHQMDASTSGGFASQLLNGAFNELEFNDTRCRILKRYKNVKVIGEFCWVLILILLICRLRCSRSCPRRSRWNYEHDGCHQKTHKTFL
jgi:hypothetical protein